MTHVRIIGALNTIVLKIPKFSNMDIHAAEDDAKSGFWYLVMYNKHGTAFMHKYIGASGRISANFLMDPNISSADCEALITVNDVSGDITMHHVGHGKLHLPGIVNSSGMKYGESDFQLAVTQYVQRYLPVGQQSVSFVPIQVTVDGGEASKCDCGAHKCGYRDDELHGHAHWCYLVPKNTRRVEHGNGD